MVETKKNPQPKKKKKILKDGTDAISYIYCEEHGLVHPLYYSRICLECDKERIKNE